MSKKTAPTATPSAPEHPRDAELVRVIGNHLLKSGLVKIKEGKNPEKVIGTIARDIHARLAAMFQIRPTPEAVPFFPMASFENIACKLADQIVLHMASRNDATSPGSKIVERMLVLPQYDLTARTIPVITRDHKFHDYGLPADDMLTTLVHGPDLFPDDWLPKSMSKDWRDHMIEIIAKDGDPDEIVKVCLRRRNLTIAPDPEVEAALRDKERAIAEKRKRPAMDSSSYRRAAFDYRHAPIDPAQAEFSEDSLIRDVDACLKSLEISANTTAEVATNLENSRVDVVLNQLRRAQEIFPYNALLWKSYILNISGKVAMKRNRARGYESAENLVISDETTFSVYPDVASGFEFQNRDADVLDVLGEFHDTFVFLRDHHAAYDSHDVETFFSFYISYLLFLCRDAEFTEVVEFCTAQNIPFHQSARRDIEGIRKNRALETARAPLVRLVISASSGNFFANALRDDAAAQFAHFSRTLHQFSQVSDKPYESLTPDERYSFVDQDVNLLIAAFFNALADEIINTPFAERQRYYDILNPLLNALQNLFPTHGAILNHIADFYIISLVAPDGRNAADPESIRNAECYQKAKEIKARLLQPESEITSTENYEYDILISYAILLIRGQENTEFDALIEANKSRITPFDLQALKLRISPVELRQKHLRAALQYKGRRM